MSQGLVVGLHDRLFYGFEFVHCIVVFVAVVTSIVMNSNFRMEII